MHKKRKKLSVSIETCVLNNWARLRLVQFCTGWKIHNLHTLLKTHFNHNLQQNKRFLAEKLIWLPSNKKKVVFFSFCLLPSSLHGNWEFGFTKCLLMTNVPQWPASPTACWEACRWGTTNTASSFVGRNVALSWCILFSSSSRQTTQSCDSSQVSGRSLSSCRSSGFSCRCDGCKF